MNFSDDLLNYELGDDIDDQDESIGNEDELLLSDEGMTGLTFRKKNTNHIVSSQKYHNNKKIYYWTTTMNC